MASNPGRPAYIVQQDHLTLRARQLVCFVSALEGWFVLVPLGVTDEQLAALAADGILTAAASREAPVLHLVRDPAGPAASAPPPGQSPPARRARRSRPRP